MSVLPSRGLHRDAQTDWARPPAPRPMGLHCDPGRRATPLFTAAAVVPALLISSLLTLTSCTVNIYWHIVTSPNQGSGGSSLTRLAAVTATNIWAVGSYTPLSGGPSKTLIEGWDGATWKIMSSPNQGSGDNQLSDVVAASISDTWAVGSYYSSGVFQTLAMRYP
jgi:hypothetical protein